MNHSTNAPQIKCLRCGGEIAVVISCHDVDQHGEGSVFTGKAHCLGCSVVAPLVAKLDRRLPVAEFERVTIGQLADSKIFAEIFRPGRSHAALIGGGAPHPMAIPASEWKWYGLAGHLPDNATPEMVGAGRFHLLTAVGRHLVSTVSWRDPRASGTGQCFETAVFDGFASCSCGCGQPAFILSGSPATRKRSASAREAQTVHEAACRLAATEGK